MNVSARVFVTFDANTGSDALKVRVIKRVSGGVSTLSRRALAIQRSSNWLQSQLEMLKIRVEKSEQALADYEKQTGLAGIELTGSSSANGVSSVSVTPENTVTSRLLALNQELTAAESNRIATEAVYHLVQSQDPEIVLGLGPMSVSSAAGGGAGSISPDAIALVNSLRAQGTDLSRQLAASSVKYGTSNPRYVELQEQVDTINKQLQTELNRVRQRAANNLAYAKRNEETIRSQFESQEKAANSMADKSVRLQILAQEAFSNRALYEGLFSKLQTSNLASGTRATRISIVDRAFAPGTPNFPKWGLALVAIFAVSIFLGVSGAFLSESLDQTIRGPEDLDEIGGVSMLGYVPRLALENALESRSIATQLISHPRSPFSEAFRSLRTALKIGTLPVHGKVFLVTSALGGDGKTTIAYNLALAFAQQSAKVLLIDADLRNPDLHNLFGAAITPGLSDLCKESFFNGVPVGIVQHPTLPRLFLLPAGTPSNFPSELIESNSFTDALAKLAMVYDYIVIDSPPILAVTDASIIATKVDSVVAVVRSRRTTRSVLDGLVQAIYRTQVPSFNFVLNDVRHPTLDGFQTYSYSREKEPKLAAGI